MYTRKFKYPKSQSFFLLGPRGTGKSTWVKNEFPQALYIDLLDEATFQDYLRNPELFSLKLNLAMPDQWVIVDEVQRIPGLLNYVHQHIENKKTKFILTGSSARKLKKETANLLAGRALLRNFNTLTTEELGSDFDLKKSLLYGHLPMAYQTESPKAFLKSYVGMYLREEIQQESLVRNLSLFSKFLETAAFSQGQILSLQTIGTELGIDRKTVDQYFQILEDLLIGFRIPVFQKRAKRKMTVRPKFFFFDTGVYRTLRQQGPLDPIEEIDGVSVETLVFQNIKSHIENLGLHLQIYFYRTQNKHEVDFIIYGDDGFFAFEVKRTSKIRAADLQHIEEFKKDYPNSQSYFIYLGNEKLKTNSGVEIIPVQDFLTNLSSIFK